MTSATTRSALAALDAVRPLIVRLDERRHPEDAAADLIEGWAGVETALRAMVGGSSLAGQALVSDVRAAGQLDYPHAHALLGFLAARDRATRPDYQPSTEDVAAARAGFQAIEAANGTGIAADTDTHPTPRQAAPVFAPSGFAPPGPPLPAPPPPSPPVRGPAAQAPPPMRSSTAPPPVDRDDRYAVPRARRSPLLLAGLVVGLLALAAGAYYLFGPARRDGTLTAAVTAYQAGRRGDARRGFETAAAADPRDPTPHVFLGRMAREDGDLARATSELTTAIGLDAGNPAAQREMGSVQLVSGQPALAISFFTRALKADSADHLAAGGMACALMQQGSPQVADKFFARAGAGPWDSCRQMAPGAPLPGTATGMAPGTTPGPAPLAPNATLPR